MRIQRFNESDKYIPSNDEEMVNLIDDIISNNVMLRQVRYEEDYEVDPDSRRDAALNILKELKEIGIDFELFYSTKKYNL